ncbi:MAG: hypothetical protein FWD68_21520 [Alphaproteobacteria bacterium]|nr:hypothetical protein [Alphaproteobacteria bacterium]
MEETAPEDMVAVALSTIGQMPISGLRHALEEDANIGWFITCGEYSDADDFFQPLCTDHLPDLLPSVIRYLRLPPGAGFVIDDTRIGRCLAELRADRKSVEAV